MKKLKAAVIGLTVGTAHLKDYLQNPNISEIIICDINGERCNSVGEQFGIAKRYTDHNEMLIKEAPDIVSVCVSNFLHKTICEDCFKAGAHVLCEKPLGRTAKECKQILKATKKHGRILMVNFNRRFTPEAAALKKAIDSGLLGEIYYAKAHWKRTRGVPWWFPLNNTKERCGGGAFIDLGVHVLDLCLWLCGYPAADRVMGPTFQKVSGEEAKRRGFENFDAEDMGVAMISAKNKMMIETEISWASNRENEQDEIKIRLYGTKGGAVIRDSIDTSGFINIQKTLILTDGNGNPYTKELETEPTENVRDAFVSSVLQNKANGTAAQAITTAKIIDAVYRSSSKGKPVTVR